ncbi:MAG: AraC family transcriptional regulator [Reichenbachiella sp.]|uniref:AraC family transcriptional regulator n=1 Tax=Reichenbachiella sp. TaxID=2184521 RepID=UPI0032640481
MTRQNPQIARYKKLLSFIDNHLKEDINIQKVEEVCHYSYRNINRIFEAIHHQTIGKYIKRLRLEKAAQYLKYSDMGVAEIAYEIGFEERAAFNKAFKNKYGCSPSSFRKSGEAMREMIQQSLLPAEGTERQRLQFEIEYLPDFEFIFLEYRGDYKDFASIDHTWGQLVNYATEQQLLSNQSIFMTEIIDDAEISDHINSRYNQALILEEPLGIEPEGLFRINSHKRQKYAKFTHQGSHESCIDFYQEIYAFWMLDVGLELVDLSLLEFYPNFDEKLPESELLTEVYIPVK